MQCKLYDEEKLVDLNNQEGNKTINDSKVKNLLLEDKSWSEMWLQYGQKSYPYDDNFISVSNYAMHNLIKKKK